MTGRFTFGAGEGTIEGQATSTDLDYDWSWSGVHGKGRLKTTSPSTFSGTWGYDDSRDGGEE